MFESFYLEAETKGLSVVLLRNEKEFPYFYDLNSGQMYGRSEPEKIFELVKLARQHSPSSDYGIHIAMLNLVAERKKLNKEGFVYWQRRYHVDSDNHKKWISLRELLKENKFDVDSLIVED